MKKKLGLLIILLNIISYGQVGISTKFPSSTLDVEGSVEGSYRTISGTSTLTDKDYHISFVATSDAVLNIPTKSSNDGTSTDFKGRKYYIKNNSTSSTLILIAAVGEIIRTGGSGVVLNNMYLLPGYLAVLTAGDANGWDLDVVAPYENQSGKWLLAQSSFNGFVNTYQNLQPLEPGVDGQKATVFNSDVTITVPSGVGTNRVVLSYTGWGDATASGGTTGSLRFQIVQTGTSNAVYKSVMMTSWSNVTAGYTRFSFPVSYAVNNLAPGTYTFTLQINRELEYTNYYAPPPSEIGLWGCQARAELFIKN